MLVQTPSTQRSTTYNVTPAPSSALAHIPGDDGWPIIGNTLSILADPKGFVEKRTQRYGPVYRGRVFGQANVSLLGPDANELVLFDTQKLFSSSLGWGTILDLLFPRGLMLLDFDEHRLHRRALSIAFKSGPMQSYLAKAQCRDSGKGLAMAVRARTQVLPRDQAVDARSGGNLVPG